MSRILRDLLTETQNPASAEIDALPVLDMLRVINTADKEVAVAVERELPNIARAVEAIVARLETGGRLFYSGAGTSGRLGVLDASECPPTFGVDFDMVQGMIAGGEAAMFRAQEGAEDSPEGGARDVDARRVGANDVFV